MYFKYFLYFLLVCSLFNLATFFTYIHANFILLNPP